jgi:pimeloyl-ACP methyl ester carboxylesterase
MRVVFIHGAFVRDGAWWWAPVAALLAPAGITSDAVALPSCGETGSSVTGTGPGLLEDAAAAGALLDDGDDAIVVASSYGGTVAAQAAAHRNVRHLVYISSVLPNIGDTHAALNPPTTEPLPVQAGPDGSVHVIDDDAAAFDERFLHDVTDAALIHGAHERLTAQSPAAFSTPTTIAAWQHIPSTYLVCVEDRNTSTALQRVHAARATRTIDLPTGHHPFLSRPDLVAAQIREIAQRS